MRGRQAVLLCATAGSVLLTQVAPANAISFFDRVFNTPAYRDHQRRQDLIRKREEQPPIVRVSSPRYYTYKPDTLKTVSLAALAVPAPQPDAVSEELPGEAPAKSEQPAPERASDAATATHDQPGEPQITGAITDAAGSDAATAAPVVVAPEVVAFDEMRGHLTDMKIDVLPEVGAAIKVHYAENPAFLWVSDGAPNDRARALMASLADAASVGLDPSDYAVELPAAPVAPAAEETVDLSAEDVEGKALMRFEMELSARALTYVLDARRGRVDPNRLSGYHDLPRQEVDLAAALKELGAAADVSAALVAHNPDSAQFRTMVRELAALRTADEGERVTIAEGTLLKPGKSDPEVANVVAAIRLRASDELKAKHADTLAAYAGTPEYTPELVDLVKDFQGEMNLTRDGVVGRNTIRALVGVTNEAKIRKLQLAMERMRWLPRELGSRNVFINQPAYTATYTQAGREPYSMRVVVGQKANQTSFFYDVIETVEYNPYWGVPYSIIVNEMLPKLYQDPTYLDRSGYEVSTVNGQRVSSASVDWGAVATKQASINVRQLPGSANALGELKILFPNKHDIYMHDTPQKHLFKRDARAFSHGCVRLADPRGMAAAVLGKSTDYIASRIAQGKNDSDEVPGQIPVYVAYFTAWPDADGTVGYYDDVYSRDDYLTKAIESTDRARRG